MNNNYNKHNSHSGQARSYSDKKHQPRHEMDTSAKPMPQDYIDRAENIMRELVQKRMQLTTSKIRNILSRISDIYNVEIDRTEEKLLPESYSSLQMARVRIAYECGRESSVWTFVDETELLRYIKGVGDSRAAFIHFARYMEALVAYHRYFGGKD